MFEAGKLQQRLNQLSLAVASFKVYTDIGISSITLKIKMKTAVLKI